MAAAPPERPAVVAVDVGHTLAAPGAISARGVTEHRFNRDLAGQVEDALSRLQLTPSVINADGLIASLRARTDAASEADFLLSIHHDSVNEWELREWTFEGRTQHYSDTWSGHSLFVSRRNPHLIHSLLCASAIGARLQRAGFAPTTKNARRHAHANEIILRPITEEFLKKLQGSLKGSNALDVLMEERLKDKEREDAKFRRS